MGNDLRDHWFKLGRTEVGTTLLVVGAVVLSWLAFAFSGGAIPAVLAYSPWSLLDGQVWRAVTWPLANGIGLGALLNLFFFWVFGTELEAHLGKNRMAGLLVGIWAIMTVVTTALGLTIGGAGWLGGIGAIEFVVLLLWIAENPRRPFFFSIPAWVIGVALVAMQVLGYIATGGFVQLLSMVITAALVAMLARRLGLLSDYAWIPGRPGAARQSRPGRPSKVAKAQQKAQRQRAEDDARLNALLDQIGEKGMDSLSPAQRRELMRLRNRR